MQRWKCTVGVYLHVFTLVISVSLNVLKGACVLFFVLGSKCVSPLSFSPVLFQEMRLENPDYKAIIKIKEEEARINEEKTLRSFLSGFFPHSRSRKFLMRFHESHWGEISFCSPSRFLCHLACRQPCSFHPKI